MEDKGSTLSQIGLDIFKYDIDKRLHLYKEYRKAIIKFH